MLAAADEDSDPELLPPPADAAADAAAAAAPLIIFSTKFDSSCSVDPCLDPLLDLLDFLVATLFLFNMSLNLIGAGLLDDEDA